MTRRKDEIGNRYGKLVVIGVAPDDGGGNVRWYYRCDCGNIRIADGCNLRNGSIHSCGCIHGKPKYYAAFKQLYNQYNQNAKNRNHELKISEDDFLNLTQRDCFYCGSPPKNVYKAAKKGASGNIDYIYSGLDRIDSNGDYSVENVVPCCKVCNGAKSKMKYEEFIAWVEAITEHYALHKDKFSSLHNRQSPEN